MPAEAKSRNIRRLGLRRAQGEGDMSYVDGFIVPMPMKKVKAYRAMAMPFQQPSITEKQHHRIFPNRRMLGGWTATT
jgi:uncharacterized protein YbaA (DUF1428 family)